MDRELGFLFVLEVGSLRLFPQELFIYPIALSSSKAKPKVYMACKAGLVGKKGSDLVRNMWISPDPPKGKLDWFFEQLLLK